MTLCTTLYDWHVGHGARMVDFAGWDMPVQYAGIVEEHNAVRGGAGLFDISHMGRLIFRGNDALGLIRRIYTNDAATMALGQVRYGLVCNDEGGIRDDVLVYRWPDEYLMVVNASNREKILGWIDASRGSLNVEIDDQTWATCMIAIQGPRAVELCRGLLENDGGTLGYYHATRTRYQQQAVVVSRTGYTGEDGLEIIAPAGQAGVLWEELVRRGARPCGLGARDTLRLEAAMPLYGHELSETIDPFQAGLTWAVKLDKGEFRGRDALLRRKDDATARQRVGLQLAGRRIAREGSEICAAGQGVGIVTSGTLSPTLGASIAMGYVDPAQQSAGSALAIDIRGTEVEGRVVKLPFYRRLKST